jgi:hypothetical protein
MGEVAVGDYVRCNVRIEQGDEDIVNSFLFRVDGSENMEDSAFLSALDDQMKYLWTPISLYIDSDVLARDISAYVVHWDTVNNKEVIDRLIGLVPFTATFTGTGTTLPHTVALLITFATAAIKTRFRKYLGGFMSSQWVGNTWHNDVLTAAATYIQRLLTGLFLQATTQMTYGGWSKSADGFTPAISGVVRSAEGTQRRRRPGVGS